MSTDTRRSPGWYPNPEDAATFRYWDGKRWTGDPRNTDPSRPAATSASKATRPPPVTPHPSRGAISTLVALGVGLVVAIVVFLILSHHHGNRDASVGNDLRSLLQSKGTYSTQAHCAHVTGNQFNCSVMINGQQRFASVTDDGHTIYEVGITP